MSLNISAKFWRVSGISRRRSVTAQVAADAPPGETSVLGFADATAPREVTIWVGGNAPSELVDISAVSELLSIAGGTVDARVLLENGTRVLEVADAGTLFEESADDDADDESRKYIKASLKIVALHVVDGEGPKRKSTLAARVLGFEASHAVTGAQTDLEVRLERLQVDQFAADARWPVLLRGSDEADADPAPLVEATCVREGNTLRCRSGVSLLLLRPARGISTSPGRGVAATRFGPSTSPATASPRIASTDYPRPGRGVAATRLDGLSPQVPRRQGDAARGDGRRDVAAGAGTGVRDALGRADGGARRARAIGPRGVGRSARDERGAAREL